MKALDADSWRRIEAILDQALDLAPEHRAAFLDEACRGDPSQRGQLEELLRATSQTADFLETPVESWLETAPEVSATAQDPAPSRVGPFRIETLLGRGGMGEVYLAERDDGQFEQRVALKLVRRGPHARGMARRLVLERRVLARLEHPGIARLIDGGLAEDGRPYLAMEYVEGHPITEFADAQRLDLGRRVDLMSGACEAVEHAHRNLVVHRDLKPSNILVSREGSVKLLDFGIARLLSPSDSELPESRETGQLLTPAYAAPEQVRGEEATTTTDVHGLGLVLYELLCGRHPFRADANTALAAAHAVLTVEAPPPSRIPVDGAASAPAARIADCRGTTARRLRRALGGDLDAIVLKALRKAPGERYGSVAALREDLERWRSGRPVAARRGTGAYRLRRFVKRHRAAVAATAGLVLSLVGGLAAALWQAGETRRAEAKARAVSEFLVEEMIGASTPESARGRSPTVREVLDASAARLPALREQPEVMAAVRTALGRAYSSLGVLDPAVEHLERSSELLAKHRGPHHPDTLRVEAALGAALVRRADYDRAASILQKVAREQRRTLGSDSLDALVTDGLTADLRRRLGDYQFAEQTLRETVLRMAEHHPDAWREHLALLTELCQVLSSQRKNSEAEALAIDILALQRARLGPDHPDVVRTLRLLGLARRRLERPDEAAAALEEARTLAERVLGLEHIETLETLGVMGAVRWDRGDSAGSLEILSTAYERARRGLGPDHPATLTHARDLAVALKFLGRTDEAEVLYRDVVDRSRRTLGIDHPASVRAAKYLGRMLLETGRRREAIVLLREVVAVAHRVARRPDADATALNDLADFLLFGQAPELHDAVTAREMAERAVAATNRRQVEFLATLGQAHHRLGERARAIEIYWELNRLPDSIYRHDMERYLLDLLAEAGDDAQAEQLLRYNLERRRKDRAPDDPLIAQSLRRMGLHHLAKGRARDAEAELGEALALLGRRLPESDWRVARARMELAAAMAGQGRFAEAEPLMLAGRDVLQRDPRAAKADRAEAVDRIVRLYEAWGRPDQATSWRAQR